MGPIVLTGARLGMYDAPAMDGVPRMTGQACTTEVLVESGSYRICAAP